MSSALYNIMLTGISGKGTVKGKAIPVTGHGGP
jgi:hypothetical protein